LFGCEQFVYRPRSCKAVPGSLYVEIAIADRGTGQERPRGQRRHDLREVERHLRRVAAEHRSDAGHIAVVAPAGQVALHVSREATEAATRNDTFHPIVEHGEEHAVVTAE